MENSVKTMITVAEASKITGLSAAHISALCKKGEVPGAQLMARTYILPRSWAEDRAAADDMSVSIKEAAATAGVSRQAIALAINSGRLERLGRRITKDSFARYLEKRKEAGK